MNRREFIRTTILGIIGTSSLALVNIDKILNETSELRDIEFAEHIMLSVNMWIKNPAYCVRITDIGEP